MNIVVGGQIDKQLLADLLEKYSKGKASIVIKSDIEAAMAIQSGSADYYFGACNTGGGGALAMAIAILGLPNCVTVGMPGKRLTEEEIIKNIDAGKKAFGFTPQDAEAVIKIIMNKLI
jgi:hypothetical protein